LPAYNFRPNCQCRPQFYQQFHLIRPLLAYVQYHSVKTFQRSKKHKLDKLSLFLLSSVGAILIRQISVYTHHKKLQSLRLTKERQCWIWAWAIPLNLLLKMSILCCSKDITLLLYGFYSSLYSQRVISPLNLSWIDARQKNRHIKLRFQCNVDIESCIPLSWFSW